MQDTKHGTWDRKKLAPLVPCPPSRVPKPRMLPCPTVSRARSARVALLLLPLLAVGASSLLPARIKEISRLVEDVRGRRFEGAVPASEIDAASLRTFLRVKLTESFPASPEETLRSLAVLGLIDETPDVVERLLDFYASQVVAFYDPEPRRFYVVRGAGSDALEGMGTGDVAE